MRYALGALGQEAGRWAITRAITMGETLRLRLLGGLRVTCGEREDAPLAGFISRKAQALLCYLAVTGRAHSREALAALLWGETSEAAARTSLRQALANLQRLVGAHLQATREAVAFDRAAPYWLDVEAFAALLAESGTSPGAASRAGNGASAGEALGRPERLRAAVALYEGDFLAGFGMPDAPAFDEWATVERERLRHLAVGALRRLAAAEVARGQGDAAIGSLRRALALEPWLEEAHRELMTALAGAGRRSEALAQYAACRRALADELGAEPAAETAALAARLRAGLTIQPEPPVSTPPVSAAPIAPSAPGGALAPAVAAATPGAAAMPGAVSVGNLPAPRTALVGRGGEVARVCDLLAPPAGGPLAEPAARLATVTGLGGVGKTVLALQAARELRAGFPDGAWLVELAPLADPALVPGAAAAVVGARPAPGTPPLEALVAFLRPRALLLVLDNCEHVLDACAELAGRVLDACPGVRLLATSREPLRIAGERQLRVGPLAAPDAGADSSPDDLAGYPAVAMFVARAQAVAPDFALTPENAAAVALVCARLDGIPLALELAAARVGVLSVAQIAARLDDCLRLLTGGSRAGPTRQQTLRAALDWSHDLLAPAQRAAFRRLAVFPGSFDLEAALAVWDDGAPDAPADLDALADLVQRSLVVAEPPPADRGPSRPGAPRYRYRLLEPVRQYAAERLAASGEEAALPARHAAHFQAVAAGARARTRRRWRLPDSLLSDLEPDLDNLRAALRWLEQQGDIEGSLALGQVVWALWARRGLGGEGRAQAQALLARVPPDGPQHHLAALGWWVALFAHATGDYARARATGEAALAAWRALGDRQGVAQALSHLGVYVRELGDDARAQALLEEGLALYRALGEPPETADTLIRLGQVFQDRGDLGRAGACYEESRALLEAAGERSVRLPHHLGSVALDEGRHAAAGDWFRESLALQHELGLREWVHSSLADLASLAAAEGDPARALRLGGAADRAAEEVGATLPPTERQRLDRWLARARQALDAGAADSAWAGGRALTVAEAVAEALAAPARHPPRAPQPAALTAPGAPGGAAALTPREREVAALIAAGCHTDRQIAARLTITPRTAGVHVQRILKKFDLHSRWQVAAWAIEHGLREAPTT